MSFPDGSVSFRSRASALRRYRLSKPRAGELVFAWTGQTFPTLFDCIGRDEDHCGDVFVERIPTGSACLILFVNPTCDSDGNIKLIVWTPVGTGWAWSSSFRRA